MSGPIAADRERRRLHVRGTVQGVGFRPFVHGLAVRHGLGGFVGNDAEGVVIEAEGDPLAVEALLADLRERAPSAAHVSTIASASLPTLGESRFSIADSTDEAGSAHVPPDIATCGECLRELFDRSNRRHLYPFINCSHCGPRFTIVRRTPYDRANTTMSGFEMCEACRGEYDDPADRRFHAEPIACFDCGPRLTIAIDELVELLRAGAIVAVKGIGGFHLACDASSESAVARLRERKQRDRRPFAVMSSDPEALGDLGDADRALLSGPERPIVLVPRRPGGAIAPSVAPDSPQLGLMLPYSPLHHLLAVAFEGPLVMTSGNRANEPIARDGAEARRRLADIADAFCDHDRPIHRRCEDSVAAGGRLLRRSRGHAPAPLPLPLAAGEPLVAVGAQLANTFCVARGNEAFVSAHLGDLDAPAAVESFRRDLRLYLAMLGVTPRRVAHDLHPDYASTAWALEQSDLEPVAVQHHHAHAAACMAEHGLAGEVLALVFDGTGYGTDGTLWGGELLRCDLTGFERLARLEPVPLPGGEAAVREPWRVAAAYLERAGRPVPFADWGLVSQSLRVNAPLSSGAGRLFDAVSALLGVCRHSTYEGQAAIELEWAAGSHRAEPYPCRTDQGVMYGADLVGAAHDDLADGRTRGEIAAAFHEGLAAAAAAACAQAGADQRTVVLSGWPASTTAG